MNQTTTIHAKTIPFHARLITVPVRCTNVSIMEFINSYLFSKTLIYEIIHSIILVYLINYAKPWILLNRFSFKNWIQYKITVCCNKLILKIRTVTRKCDRRRLLMPISIIRKNNYFFYYLSLIYVDNPQQILTFHVEMTNAGMWFQINSNCCFFLSFSLLTFRIILHVLFYLNNKRVEFNQSRH